MIGLKIFVQIQTFRRRPFVPSQNFCHPAADIWNWPGHWPWPTPYPWHWSKWPQTYLTIVAIIDIWHCDLDLETNLHHIPDTDSVTSDLPDHCHHKWQAPVGTEPLLGPSCSESCGWSLPPWRINCVVSDRWGQSWWEGLDGEDVWENIWDLEVVWDFKNNW